MMPLSSYLTCYSGHFLRYTLVDAVTTTAIIMISWPSSMSFSLSAQLLAHSNFFDGDKVIHDHPHSGANLPTTIWEKFKN